MDTPDTTTPVVEDLTIEERLEQFHREAENGTTANLVTDMRDLLALSY